MKAKLTINYDDQPDQVMEKVKKLLVNFGIVVDFGDGGDGWQDYLLENSDDSEKP